MKRKELIDLTERLARENYRNRKKLYYCTAHYIDTPTAIILQSYNTYVAIYNKDNGTLYVFNNYSSTTYQHIYKFARLINAMRICWLYKRYDKCIETSLSQYANTHKIDNAIYDVLESYDYSLYISSKW